MFGWEWEDFEELIRDYHALVVEPGPLHAPIRSFEISRDKELQLRMTVRSPQNASGGAASPPAGTVRINTDKVSFSSQFGLDLVAEGVHVAQTNTRIHDDPALGELVQDCSVHKLTGQLVAEGRSIDHVIDWVDNLDHVFLWPHHIEASTHKLRSIVLRSETEVLTLSGEATPEGSGRKCVHFVVGGHSIWLCCAEPPPSEKRTRRGFIVYSGNPTHDFRDRIRRCLSFALGTYLVYLGNTAFDSQWQTVQFEAISAYSMWGRAFELGPMPPSPLGLQYEWEIDPDILEKVVNSLFCQYDNLNFGVVSWAYWHAVGATPHIAGAHFGAAIQSLERAFLKTTSLKMRRTLLGADDWKRLQLDLEGTLAGKRYLAEDVAILRNKINGLNSMPQGMVTNQLLARLGLQFGPRENIAADLVRNKSAHGKDDEVTTEWIRDLKLLRLRFNRMVLAMTNANDFYYDYFSLGRPTRKLEEPVA